MPDINLVFSNCGTHFFWGINVSGHSFKSTRAIVDINSLEHICVDLGKIQLKDLIAGCAQISIFLESFLDVRGMLTYTEISDSQGIKI